MELLESSYNTIDKDKDGELVAKLEIVEVVLIHCNLVNNNYQQASKVLFTFVPNRQFGQLITPNTSNVLKKPILNFLLLKFGLIIKIINH